MTEPTEPTERDEKLREALSHLGKTGELLSELQTQVEIGYSNGVVKFQVNPIIEEEGVSHHVVYTS